VKRLGLKNGAPSAWIVKKVPMAHGWVGITVVLGHGLKVASVQALQKVHACLILIRWCSSSNIVWDSAVIRGDFITIF
jgi:hypothetical protein